MSNTQAQARLWAARARDWISSGRRDDFARFSYAWCVSQARAWTRYTTGVA